uniref:NADH dehydrogenase subunit 4L n=1 Tax=Drupina grossularia TaxID=500100 RepID=UPI0020292047|nr:NADH dehydrogenase subunit 4L [Drupina grossularia]UQS76066.1 NADH dehydrogenase subunit 4L [Drupina grossularia]
MSTFYLSLLSLFGVLMSFLTLSLQYKHLLSILLSLEAVTMSLFIMMFCAANNTALSGQASLILITMGACEASLGLAILVAIIRSEGNDYVSSFSTHNC